MIARHRSPAASPHRAAGRDSAGEEWLPSIRGIGKRMVATPYSGWAALPKIACVMLCAPFSFWICFWIKKKRRSVVIKTTKPALGTNNVIKKELPAHYCE